MPEGEHIEAARHWRQWAEDHWTETALPINVEFAMWLAQYHATMALYELIEAKETARA